MTHALGQAFAKKYATWHTSFASRRPIARSHKRSQATWTMRQRKRVTDA
jgi:hypothetical protein